MELALIVCTISLLSCIYALHMALEAQTRHEKYVVKKMMIDDEKIEAAIEDYNKGINL